MHSKKIYVAEVPERRAKEWDWKVLAKMMAKNILKLMKSSNPEIQENSQTMGEQLERKTHPGVS